MTDTSSISAPAMRMGRMKSCLMAMLLLLLPASHSAAWEVRFESVTDGVFAYVRVGRDSDGIRRFLTQAIDFK